MFGWGTGVTLGVAGASLASFIALVARCIAFVSYFYRKSSHLHFRREDWEPRPRLWGEMLQAGLPVGGEFAIMSFYLIFVYGLIRPFGSAAQAGFGIGVRIMQSMFLPAIASSSLRLLVFAIPAYWMSHQPGFEMRQIWYLAAGSVVLQMCITVGLLFREFGRKLAL